MDQRSKLKSQNYKTLRRKQGGNLHWARFGNRFLSITPKAQRTKEKLDKLDFIKIKNSPSKDTIKRVGRQLTEWEKISVGKNILADKD